MPTRKVQQKQQSQKVTTPAVSAGAQSFDAPKVIPGEMSDQQLIILIVILVAGFLLGLLAVSVKVAL